MVRVKQGYAEGGPVLQNQRDSESWIISQNTFSVKGQRINIISFMGHTVSVTMTPLYCYGVEATKIIHQGIGMAEHP